MPREKFKLSDTVRFLAQRINAAIGAGEVALTLEVATPIVRPGAHARAEIKLIGEGERARTIDALVIAMEGKVQREGAWRDYTEAVEIAQGLRLEAGQELIVPLEVYVPRDAALSEDGAQWRFESRAVLDGALDPLAAASFEVAGEPWGGGEEE